MQMTVTQTGSIGTLPQGTQGGPLYEYAAVEAFGAVGDGVGAEQHGQDRSRIGGRIAQPDLGHDRHGQGVQGRVPARIAGLTRARRAPPDGRGKAGAGAVSPA